MTVVYVHWLPVAVAVTTVVRTVSDSAVQPGFLVGFANGGLLGCLVAVAGAAGQTPGAALVTPRRPVLQQDRG